MNRRYWLGLGPITRDERSRAFTYLDKRGLPRDRNSDAFRNFVARLRKRREINRFLRGKTAASPEPSAPWQVLYGDVRTGGVLTFAHTSGPDSNDPNKYLHLVITLAAHEIHRIVAVYFDDYQLGWDTDLSTRPTGVVNAVGIFAGLVRMQINYGSDGQAALSAPLADSSGYNPVSAKWTADHKQSGHAHVYFRLTYNENVFKNGMPDIDFRLLGTQNIVDPRTGLIGPGGSNAAAVLYDYMTNTRYGMGLSTDLFNLPRWQQAVTDCEDSIALAGGGTQFRYLVNAVITSDEAPGTVVDEMLGSMAGRLTYTEGKFSLYVGKGRTGEGHVLEITEDMILSDVKLLTKTPRIDSFNTVRGTFVSETNSHEESDFPAVTNATYKAEDDGKEIIEDLTFGMVTDAARCQRLAKIELEANRQGIFVEFTGSLACYAAEPGDWVGVTFSRFGWGSKTFEVVRLTLQDEESEDGTPAHTVRLTLKETSSAIYDWNTGHETTYDVAPNTNLPDPFAVAAPTALSLASGTDHLYVRSDGTVFSRLHCSWTGAADTFVRNGGYYEIQYKKSSASDWQDAGDVPGSSSSTYILDVEDGSAYDVRVRSVNALGARSDWLAATGHTVVGKTAPPSDVSGFGVTVDGFGVRLAWDAVPDLDVREYELRHGTTSQDWAAMAATAIRVQATAFFFKTFAAGDHRFRIKAVDTSGNYSGSDASVDLAVAAPGAVQSLVVSQIDNNVVVDWEAPSTGTFPIAGYNVYKEDADTGQILLGRVGGSFFTYVETLQGTYTYTIKAIDTAGNEGAGADATRTIYPPPDFVLRTSTLLDASTAALSNAVLVSFLPSFFNQILCPVDTSQTWEQHFTSNGATTIQDLIDAGYTYWMQPAPTDITATVDFDYDVGAVLPQCAISVRFSEFDWDIGCVAVPTLQWRQSTSDPWISGKVGAFSASATNFRYIRIHVEVTSPDEFDLVGLQLFRLTIHVKELTDSGTATASAADSGGTAVSFNKDFLDVSSIVVTPQATSARFAVVDFDDAANPISFKVLLYDVDGNRVSGDFKWSARGVQAVL